jgi:pyruvate/2-oxoglutarate dehydrogenase complex dihydrolipoamide dehydrogenase (E3) component
MNELRKAAEMALKALEDIFGKEKKDVGAINALRQALAQPEREWVGLTDEEIQAERHKLDPTAGWTYDHFARAIEAKLKEKNGG